MLLQIRFLLCSRGVSAGGGVRKKTGKIIELNSPARRGREVRLNTASESTNIHGMRCGEPKRRSVEEFRRIIILLII